MKIGYAQKADDDEELSAPPDESKPMEVVFILNPNEFRVVAGCICAGFAGLLNLGLEGPITTVLEDVHTELHSFIEGDGRPYQETLRH